MKKTKDIAIATFVTTGFGVLAFITFDHAWHAQGAELVRELGAQSYDSSQELLKRS